MSRQQQQGSGSQPLVTVSPPVASAASQCFLTSSEETHSKPSGAPACAEPFQMRLKVMERRMSARVNHQTEAHYKCQLDRRRPFPDRLCCQDQDSVWQLSPAPRYAALARLQDRRPIPAEDAIVFHLNNCSAVRAEAASAERTLSWPTGCWEWARCCHTRTPRCHYCLTELLRRLLRLSRPPSSPSSACACWEEHGWIQPSMLT